MGTAWSQIAIDTFGLGPLARTHSTEFTARSGALARADAIPGPRLALSKQGNEGNRPHIPDSTPDAQLGGCATARTDRRCERASLLRADRRLRCRRAAPWRSCRSRSLSVPWGFAETPRGLTTAKTSPTFRACLGTLERGGALRFAAHRSERHFLHAHTVCNLQSENSGPIQRYQDVPAVVRREVGDVTVRQSDQQVWREKFEIVIPGRGQIHIRCLGLSEKRRQALRELETFTANPYRRRR